MNSGGDRTIIDFVCGSGTKRTRPMILLIGISSSRPVLPRDPAAAQGGVYSSGFDWVSLLEPALVLSVVLSIADSPLSPCLVRRIRACWPGMTNNALRRSVRSSGSAYFSSITSGTSPISWLSSSFTRPSITSYAPAMLLMTMIFFVPGTSSNVNCPKSGPTIFFLSSSSKPK